MILLIGLLLVALLLEGLAIWQLRVNRQEFERLMAIPESDLRRGYAEWLQTKRVAKQYVLPRFGDWWEEWHRGMETKQ